MALVSVSLESDEGTHISMCKISSISNGKVPVLRALTVNSNVQPIALIKHGLKLNIVYTMRN
jgi:hypothetical protein